ncbi:hypothetical protein MJ561_17580 [Klebsiella pneumoniae]|nr:hypothetical protein MJ561_17580 [Klebsiella pneumoniae]
MIWKDAKWPSGRCSPFANLAETMKNVQLIEDGLLALRKTGSADICCDGTGFVAAGLKLNELFSKESSL